MFQREILLKLPQLAGRTELVLGLVPHLEHVERLWFIGWKGNFGPAPTDPEVLVRFETPGASSTVACAYGTDPSLAHPGPGLYITPEARPAGSTEQQGPTGYATRPLLLAERCGAVGRLRLLITDFQGESTKCISAGPLYLRLLADVRLPNFNSSTGQLQNWGTVGDGTILGAPL